MKELMFDKRKLARFEVAYNMAVKYGLEKFMFDNNEFVTKYAKYVIEYVKTKF